MVATYVQTVAHICACVFILVSTTYPAHAGNTILSKTSSFKKTSRSVIEYGNALPPFGYVSFCATYKNDSACRKTQSRALQSSEEVYDILYEVNSEVNELVQPASDMTTYGVQEKWSYPTDQGDCEDYVLLKRYRLLKRGLPASALRIAVVLDEHRECSACRSHTDCGWHRGPSSRQPHERHTILRSHWLHVSSLELRNQSTRVGRAQTKSSHSNHKHTRVAHVHKTVTAWEFFTCGFSVVEMACRSLHDQYPNWILCMLRAKYAQSGFTLQTSLRSVRSGRIEPYRFSTRCGYFRCYAETTAQRLRFPHVKHAGASLISTHKKTPINGAFSCVDVCSVTLNSCLKT
jgi:predicted transglutaminase-like cysteine proteinase